MNILEFIQGINAGGFVAGLVLVLGLVEIAPIKISPLAWIGRRLNKETIEKVKKIEEKIKKIEEKTDEHIAGSYRSAILKFADDVQADVPKTKENWKEIINAISKYRVHCEANHVENGLCDQSSQFLEFEYQKRLRSGDFAPALATGVLHQN